jgi:energy-coupling factor transporter ATP-binding protein EcfA2
MRIQRLIVKRFRGIKTLDWVIPRDQRLIALVGPGDSGKSTILEAIHLLLGDRWNVAFTDTDFYRVDVTEPITIRAVLVDIPAPLLKDGALGLWLTGLADTGELFQDPEDHLTPALLVQLSVDSTLEPHWTVERVEGQSHALSATQRRHFSTFKVDDRTDSQLRWSRTSALGRLSAEQGGEREALAAASRAARDALLHHQSSPLAQLSLAVQDRVNAIGGGRFANFRPGLDTSRSAFGTGLALFEDEVPVTSFGLGSRRLASLAIQQLAAGNRSLALVDEIEDGLEPHRAVRLLQYLLTAGEYSQVIATTHSAVVVEQARIENLASVQCADGAVTVTSLGGSDETLQRIRRSRPSSLLARKVVVAEGKTEHGLLLACIEEWDATRTLAGLSTAAGEGIAIQDGQGGSEVPLRAAALSTLGMAAAGFMDNDDRGADAAVLSAREAGVTIVRWNSGCNTESQVCSSLDVASLSAIISLAVEQRGSPHTVLNDLHSVAPTLSLPSLQVDEWLASGVLLVEARSVVAAAAHSRNWFKSVEGGIVLGSWIMRNSAHQELAGVMSVLADAYKFIYSTSRQPTVGSRSEGGTDG